MVKKLDLLESWLQAERIIQRKAFQNGSNTTLHVPYLTRNVFPEPFGAEDITHGFSTFEYFDHTGIDEPAKPDFGRLTSNGDLLNSPRQMQLALKLYW